MECHLLSCRGLELHQNALNIHHNNTVTCNAFSIPNISFQKIIAQINTCAKIYWNILQCQIRCRCTNSAVCLTNIQPPINSHRYTYNFTRGL